MRKRNGWNIETIDLSTKEVQSEHEKEDSLFIRFLKRYWKRTLIIFGILYLIVVIFGLVSMRYYYDENGNRRLYPLSFSSLPQ